MARLTVADLAGPASVEVDLWGAEFVSVPVTRTRQRALEALQREFNEIDENAVDVDDQAVAVLARMLDEQLVPAEGNRKKASAVILKKWRGDELTVDQLAALQQQLAAAVRPT